MEISDKEDLIKSRKSCNYRKIMKYIAVIMKLIGLIWKWIGAAVLLALVTRNQVSVLYLEILILLDPATYYGGR